MKSKKIPYIWISPLITLIIMLILFALAGVFPFGALSTAAVDGIAQYIPFMAELSDKIREGGSLFFTWHAGMGVNFWSNIAYYLASPLNLIALFFTPDKMGDAFSIITLIKPVLAALTFGIFLKYAYKKNDLSVTSFSVLWSLSGFMLFGMSFTAWYDSIIYFPLVILGLKRLMDGKSSVLYAVSLALSIISNFYIGWMICIFSVIYFIYSLIADDEVAYEGTGVSDDGGEEETVNIFATLKNSYILNSFFRFVGSSLIAGGLSAIFTLPLYNTLQNTVKGTTATDFIMPNGVWGILASHIFPFASTYKTFMSRDYIFAFCGTATLILAVSYFFAKGISLRKKIGNLFLLAVMWTSVIFFPVYTIWHGFGIPEGLTYRFAFIYSFILLKIAYEAFINIKKIPIYGILAGTVFAGICTAGIYFDDTLKQEIFSVSLIVTIAALIVIFSVLLLIMTKKVKAQTALTAVLLLCVVGESIVLNRDNIKTFDAGNDLSEYEIVKEASEKLEPHEQMMFVSREQKFTNMIMYGMAFGYNGPEYYSSMADASFVRSFTRMGSFGNGTNSENGGDSQTPVFNMMFPAEYTLDGKNELDDNIMRDKISERDGYTLYKNNYTMPFMYTVSRDIDEWSPHIYPIKPDNQNAALKALTGTEESAVSYNTNDNFTYENCSHVSYVDAMREAYEKEGMTFPEEHAHYYEMFESKMDSFAYEIDDLSKTASISFDTTALTDGLMYFYVDGKQFVDMTVEINGEKTDYDIYGIGSRKIYEIGEVKKGDTARITIGGSHAEEGNPYLTKTSDMSAIGFTIDREALDKAYNKLDAMSDTEVLEFKDTYVKAKVTSYEDGYLYIPTAYDEGWTILIDGKEAPLHEHHSHILMTEIGAGEHTVEMKYMPEGFAAGAAVTSVCALVLVAWAVILIRKEKKK